MSHDVTEMLAAVSSGREGAVDELLPVVYDELREIAERSLRHERSDHTLQATALVHEAYLKLVRQQGLTWKNRAHFLAVAARAARQILIDHARGLKRRKRGGERGRDPLEHVSVAAPERGIDLVALDEALLRLTENSPRKGRVVEMRYFSGASTDEIAEVLGVTTRTVERDWRFARAWLYRELAPEGDRPR